jgi:hypothetical protein
MELGNPQNLSILYQKWDRKASLSLEKNFSPDCMRLFGKLVLLFSAYPGVEPGVK